jgi:tetratricopeptide (TPR) repeat protein
MAHDATRHPELALQALDEGAAKSGSLELGVELASRQDLLGQHDAAIKTYEQLLARAPKSMPVANNLAMMLINRRGDAASLERADQLASVLAGSEQASFLDTRGWIKFRRGDIQAALPLLQQAAAKSPQSPEIQYHLGMVQYRSGNKDAARQSLEIAVAGKSSFAGLDEARTTLAALQNRG